MITRKKEVLKLFHSNMDEDTFEINGSKLGLSNGVCVMPNSEVYKMMNQVMFTNLYEYYLGEEEQMQVLLTEARLTSRIEEASDFKFHNKF